MTSNEHHEWLKKRDWPAVEGAILDPERDEDLLRRKYKERDEHGRLPHHWMAAKAQKHTHALAFVGVQSICYNPEALTTRDNDGETPIDIARRSGACAEIISLLSLTPDEARSLDWKGMRRLYAPVAYWRNEMVTWIRSRSWADCHKWINEHDDELVREVLKYYNSELLRQLACYSQAYSDSLVFLALRMIYRSPLSLTDKDTIHAETALQWAQLPQFNACKEIVKVLRLTPNYISSTPFPTLLRQSLPTKHHEIYGPYNTACTFIKHMKYDKAELVEIEAVGLSGGWARWLLARLLVLLPRRLHAGEGTVERVLAPGARFRTEGAADIALASRLQELRTLHKGIALLNMCIQRSGAGDGPTSVVVDFLLPGPAY